MKEKPPVRPEAVFSALPVGTPTVKRINELRRDPLSEAAPSKQEAYALTGLLAEKLVQKTLDKLSEEEYLTKRKRVYAQKHTLFEVNDDGEFQLRDYSFTADQVVHDFTALREIYTHTARKMYLAPNPHGILKEEENTSSSLGREFVEENTILIDRLQTLIKNRPEDWSHEAPHRSLSPRELILAGLNTSANEAWTLLLALPRLYQEKTGQPITPAIYEQLAFSAERLFVQVSSFHLLQMTLYNESGRQRGIQHDSRVAYELDDLSLQSVLGWWGKVDIHESGEQAHLDWKPDFLNELNAFQPEKHFARDLLQEPRQGCPARDVRVDVGREKKKSATLGALYALMPVAQEVILPHQEFFWGKVDQYLDRKSRY